MCTQARNAFMPAIGSVLERLGFMLTPMEHMPFPSMLHHRDCLKFFGTMPWADNREP